MSRTTQWLSWLFATAGLAVLAVAESAAQGTPLAVQVTVAHPLTKRITQWDEFAGRFEAVEKVEVRARVSGFIEQVHFKDGERVAKGDLLFTVDQRPFRIALESAAAELARARAQLELGEQEVARATPLTRSGTVTQRELDQRRATLGVARAALQAGEAAVKSAELNLEWTEVRAPFAGRVSDRKVDAGNLIVGGQTGATLLTTIVSTDPIHFVIEASEADYLRYMRLARNGQRKLSRDEPNPVQVKLADETEWKHAGRMEFIDNVLNPRSGTIRARATLENKDETLAPGLFGRLRLYGGEFDALLVPDTAIVADQTLKTVLVTGPDNVVAARRVVLGPMAEGLRVIREGLNPGDKVIISGQANPMVRPGAKVAVQNGEIKFASR